MSNFVLVIVVFLIGMGWGAAAMVIPMHREMDKIVGWLKESCEIMASVAETQQHELTSLQKVSKDCGGVIVGTKGVIESVDKLIEEIGNEI